MKNKNVISVAVCLVAIVVACWLSNPHPPAHAQVTDNFTLLTNACPQLATNTIATTSSINVDGLNNITVGIRASNQGSTNRLLIPIPIQGSMDDSTWFDLDNRYRIGVAMNGTNVIGVLTNLDVSWLKFIRVGPLENISGVGYAAVTTNELRITSVGFYRRK